MDPEKSLRTWKRIALVSLAVAVLASGVAILLLRLRFQREDRLLGTWQSDADRTLAAIREVSPVDEAREGALRKLYGKLRITYTGGTYTSDFDGSTETTRYEVLGKDDRSVVIGEIDPKPSELDEILQMSRFTVIHFEGPDAYWIHVQHTDTREYFRRVPPP